ncbi:receptor-like cytosolic serine/threonine-protein kinase RBK2 isoform X2 [Pistacia vera]|nr:receptor-like cytosolic serine/threonine-protein kinase RBK2 isoform X2 [Pistacia vera]
MEKERQDVSSPKGVLEACLKGSESDTVSSKDSSSESDILCSKTQASTNWRKFFKSWKRRSIKRLATFPPLPMAMTCRRKNRSTREEDHEMTHIYEYKSSLKEFTLSELQIATNNFSKENMIGRGGYAEVYKGCLPNGRLVAVKRLTKGTESERTSGFLCEIGIIAYVDHPNTAKLIGCDSDGMHLVFQLSPLGSLGSLLHGSKDKLDWSKRYKIALGTADGLTYLHESCEKRIIHRDIKADNILLTEDFEPQICDFGLAKWLPRQWTHHNVSKFEGTFGYFAPEYFMHGVVDEKTDVYAFGVLLLELITGRRAVDHLQQSVVIWAKPLLDNNDIRELVDPSLCNNYDRDEMDRVVLTASLCIEQSPILRPRMSQVVILLRGDESAAQCAKECHKGTLRRSYSEHLLDAQEYNSTRYLSDLNRLKEVALGS